MNKKGPIILLSVLAVVAFFIIGVRYGQKIEETNQKISLAQLTPKISSTPAVPLVEFSQYNNQACLISFLVPSTLTVTGEATNAARFEQDHKQLLSFDCSPNAISTFDNLHTASSEITFQNKKISTKLTNADRQYVFMITNPASRKKIMLSFDKTLLPLIDKSFEFISPLVK